MAKKTNKALFALPILIGVLITQALVVALIIDDSIWEQISLLGLLIPIWVAAYYYWFKKWH